MNKLKILLVCEQPLPSEKRAGRPNFTLEFLSKIGHEITVICPKPRTAKGNDDCVSKERQVEKSTINFEYLPIHFDQFSVTTRIRTMKLIRKSIEKEIKRNRYDIVRSNSVLPSYACVQVIDGQIPVYGELTDVLSDYYVQFNMPFKILGEPVAERIQKRISRDITLASVDTPAGRKRWTDFGMRKEKIVVNPNGVDTNHFSSHLTVDPSIKSELGFASNSTILVWHGDISRNDGIECLLKAMVFLEPNFVLEIIGSGPDKYVAHLKKMAATLELGSRVAFTGWIDYARLPNYLAVADIGIAPALPASPVNRVVFLAKIKEYVAMGKNVVATQTEGLKDMIGDDVLFYIIDPSNSKELASRIKFASTQVMDNERLKKMQFVSSKIDWENIIKKDSQIMTALVDGELSDASEYDLKLS